MIAVCLVKIKDVGTMSMNNRSHGKRNQLSRYDASGWSGNFCRPDNDWRPGWHVFDVHHHVRRPATLQQVSRSSALNVLSLLKLNAKSKT